MKKGDSFFLAAIVETKVCEDISRCSGGVFFGDFSVMDTENSFGISVCS